jgi:UDP-GlcNAc:undecaprenyl-phosphate GlcNAc-1-phosphate transferase
MATGIASLLIPPVLRLARRWRLLDLPDGERKVHAHAIPRLGGIAIVTGFMAPIIGLLFFGNAFADQLVADHGRLVSFVAGAGAILVLGVFDDIKGLAALPKLLVQSAVGATLWAGGLALDSVSFMGETIEFSWASLPLTILWVAGIINAMNLIDGLDGLAGGVAFIASGCLWALATFDGNPILGLFAAALAGAVLGFLLYNFSPAMIFMGDSGSMTIGYVFAAAGLWSAGKRATAMALLLPVVALGLPVVDTLYAIARRTAHGQSPFHSDRGHIHHRLLDAGYSQRQAVLLLYAVCAVLATVVVVVRSTDEPAYGILIAAVAAALVAVARGLMHRWGTRPPGNGDPPG